MMVRVPRFPDLDKAPSFDEMTRLLLQGLREKDRREAEILLLEQILPRCLPNLQDDPDPLLICEWVYEEIADELSAAAEAERLDVLRAFACTVRIRELEKLALALAISRYLKEEPADLERSGEWLNPLVQRWLTRTVVEIVAEAEQGLEKLEAWKAWADVFYPEVWDDCRLQYLRTENNLKSARSGFFGTAAGRLYDFLTSLGHHPDWVGQR